MSVEDHVAFPDYVDIRFYETGWTIRLGLLLVRWNHQHAYTSFEIMKLRQDTQWQGGMTFKEFRANQKAERIKKAEARAKHMEEKTDDTKA